MSKEAAIRLALSMYTDEPCRICGNLITYDDINNSDVVWVGYSEDNKARTAYKECWDTYPSTEEDGPHPMWVYQ